MAKLAVVPDLEKELDRLYALPLEQFTQTRNDLAARLRQAGQKEAADEVKSLRKPTVAAWTVNQLARTNAAAMKKLVRAAEQLRKAQAEALSGTSARLRDAQAAERDAVRDLTAAARKLGASDATAERVSATLRAAAVDPSALQQVQAGRLTTEIEPSGFQALAGMAPAKPAQRGKPKDDGAARRRREQLRKLREEARTLAREATDAEREAARAEHEAEHARKEAERARARADEAAERVAQAEQE